MMNSSAKYPPVASRYRSLINAGRFIKNPFPILDQALGKLGTTYAFYMGGVQKAVLTIDPKVARYILQKHHRAYEKSEIVSEILAKYLGKGLLTNTGDDWLRQRRLIQPGFHRKRIESLQNLMRTEVEAGMVSWRIKSSGRMMLDAYREMNQLTFRIIARALFSDYIEESGLTELSDLISTIQAYIIREVRQPHKRWWYKISGIRAKHIRLALGANELIRDIVTKRRASTSMPDDLLTMLMETRYEDTGEGMTDDQLIDECLILFVAGHETSANALSWMIYLLGNHPDEYARLQNATNETQAQLIKNVIEESMRLYPPAWVVDRVSLEEDQVGEFLLPKGTVWVIYIRGIHRNPAYWEKPDQFIPDRWSDPNLNKEAYMAFGAGPRLCIGEHFAMMEMQLILTTIVNTWDFTLISKKVAEKPLVTLRPGSEIYISIAPKSPKGDFHPIL
ncbi:MAG: cytochrome P450 [Saprospiraceae bacterium]